jgi:copper(I)-binding protein
MEIHMIKLSAMAACSLLIAVAWIGKAPAQQMKEVKTQDIVIAQPWSRATPAGAKIAVGYMVITNNGTEADRLVGGSSGAGAVEVHEMAMKNGVMTMRPVSGGLQIEPGKSVTLAPGGNHLMFTDVKAPLKQGDKLKATLEFAKAGQVDVTFDVQSIGAQSPMPMPGHSDHKM